jgi:hypothetical protein
MRHVIKRIGWFKLKAACIAFQTILNISYQNCRSPKTKGECKFWSWTRNFTSIKLVLLIINNIHELYTFYAEANSWSLVGMNWHMQNEIGAPAGATRFTASYFVSYLKYQFCSPSSTLSFQTNLFFLNLLYFIRFIAWLFSKTTYYFVKPI